MGFFDKLFGGEKEAEEDSGPGVFARLEGAGDFDLDIVGESNYQGALEEICGGRCYDGQKKRVEAMLIHNDDNKYDEQAIAVAIDGQLVGFLDRDMARSFRRRMSEAGAAGVPAIVQALIVGGWDRGGGDTGHFGVRLDLPVEGDDLDDEDSDDDFDDDDS